MKKTDITDNTLSYILSHFVDDYDQVTFDDIQDCIDELRRSLDEAIAIREKLK